MLAVQLDIRTAEIYTCAFAPDGVRALTGSQGNPDGLWDLTRGTRLASCPRVSARTNEAPSPAI